MAQSKKKLKGGAAQAAPPFFKTGVGRASIILGLLLIGAFLWSYFSGSHVTPEAPDGLRSNLTDVPLGEETAPEQPMKEAEDGLALNVPVRRGAAMDFTLAGEGVEITPELIAQVTQPSEVGPLPKISSTGLSVYKLYSRKLDGIPEGAKVGIIIRDLGLSNSALTEALQQVPADVTLALSPYSSDLTEKFQEITGSGFEALLMLPMESARFGHDDSGPNTLLVSLSVAENIKRLEWVLSRGQGYYGVFTEAGTRFVLQSEMLRPILEQLRRRGVAVIDGSLEDRSQISRLATQLGALHNFVLTDLDQTASERVFQQELERLETYALKHGNAIGVMRPYALSLQQLKEWAGTLESKNITLVPVSMITSQETYRYEE